MDRADKTALVSTYDKHGVAELCRGLHELGFRILSSGGTAKLLDSEGVPVSRVSEYTGAPEILGGRVKTLHPKVHGGILAVRSDAGHMAELERQGIDAIDLVVVNLYPFRETAARPGATSEQVVEMIDIGGPTLIRAAAKNHADVGVLVDPADYPAALDEIRREGGLGDATRRRLAAKAFDHTRAYDEAVHAWLAGTTPADEAGAEPFPARMRIELVKAQDLRYGENPHQRAAFYRDARDGAGSLAGARQVQGKELSFNNLLDFDAALDLAAAFGEGACVIVKHGNPCGTALGDEPATAFRRALECDPLSAFGGVIAFNRVVDEGAARAVVEAFYEGVIAPAFDDAARSVLRAKKNLRLLEIGDLSGYARPGLDLRRVGGGMLAQDWDVCDPPIRQARVVSARQPTETEWNALQFAWTIVRHVKSNAIVYAVEDRTVGIGAGQMSRVDSARLGIDKAQVPLQGAVMASDAFFPFRDGVDVAAEAGIAAVIQPGGSIRDAEVIRAADDHGMAMVLTGRRHFRH